MIHIMMDINEHQDQRYTRGDNNGRDLYLLGVNVLVINTFHKIQKNTPVISIRRFLFLWKSGFNVSAAFVSL